MQAACFVRRVNYQVIMRRFWRRMCNGLHSNQETPGGKCASYRSDTICSLSGTLRLHCRGRFREWVVINLFHAALRFSKFQPSQLAPAYSSQLLQLPTLLVSSSLLQPVTPASNHLSYSSLLQPATPASNPLS